MSSLSDAELKKMAERAPTYAELIGRMSNNKAFMRKIGAIMAGDASDRVVPMLYSPGDSQEPFREIKMMLNVIFGHECLIFDIGAPRSEITQASAKELAKGKKLVFFEMMTKEFFENEFKHFDAIHGLHSIIGTRCLL